MSRSPRIGFPGAWYHVMNRGAGKNNIYTSEEDYHLFLAVLNDTISYFDIELHAYCLMNNHYHLLIHTPLANISKAMQYLGSAYTRKYNQNHRSDGPIFRGRFKSILVDDDSYLLHLSRYIHLNPVKAHITKEPKDYPWSSYNAYISPEKPTNWLHTEFILNMLGDKEQIKLYALFVNDLESI